MVVAAITVHPSLCHYTRTGFRLGYGQRSHSADPGSGRDWNSSVPFLSALSHPLFSTFQMQYFASQLFFKALFAVSIHACTLRVLHYLLAFPYVSLASSIKGFGEKRGLHAVINF